MDRDIVIRARAGDRDAFSMLATASIGRLNAVARLIVRDDGRAEDAVQDALIDAFGRGRIAVDGHGANPAGGRRAAGRQR